MGDEYKGSVDVNPEIQCKTPTASPTSYLSIALGAWCITLANLAYHAIKPLTEPAYERCRAKGRARDLAYRPIKPLAETAYERCRAKGRARDLAYRPIKPRIKGVLLIPHTKAAQLNPYIKRAY